MISHGRRSQHQLAEGVRVEREVGDVRVGKDQTRFKRGWMNWDDRLR